jgi:2-polyprenyl-6-methoxyphenol hydroxylase-like FAD-dependent oxidoreductase
MKVLIVGSGIGGLAFANALEQKKIDYILAERSPSFGEVGAGISLWANAAKIIKHWGLLDDVVLAAPSVNHDRAKVLSATGKVLVELDYQLSHRTIGCGTYIVKRPDLHAALASRVPPSKVRLAHELISFEQQSEKVVARFSNGTEIEADVIVGADGIWSTVRRTIFGDTTMRYSGQTCYRGIAHFSGTGFPITNVEMQGSGRRMGIHSINANMVYWWAAVNSAANIREDNSARKKTVLNAFRGFPSRASEVLEHTQDFLKNDLCDIGYPKRWSQGRAVLLGDAAHAMLPNLGQGACTAIEDAYILAACLGRLSYSDALIAYEKLRIPRAILLSKRSWLWGRLALWNSPRKVRFREWIWKSIPKNLLRREADQQLLYDAVEVVQKEMGP